MTLVDTSIWVEFFRGNEPYLTEVGELLEAGQVLAIECVFGELMQGARTTRERKVIGDYWSSLPKFSMDGIFFRAGMESGKSKWWAMGVGLIDACIITAARDTATKVWTLDKGLKSLLQDGEKR